MSDSHLRRIDTASSSLNQVSPKIPSPLATLKTTTTPHIALSPSTPPYILLPTTRSLPVTPHPPGSHKSWQQAAHIRAKRKHLRSSSVDLLGPNFAQEHVWFTLGKLSLTVFAQDIEISGYQLFAVEKWLVDRRRLNRTVTVYTGKEEDKMLVTVLVPLVKPNSSEDSVAIFDKAIAELSKDGARPKQTDKGVVMITSLANFRSDLNIIRIPNGNFGLIRNALYVNINLLRMGCSGRSGLTLDEPNSSSKEKFLQMYQLPEPNGSSSANESFQTCNLELVRTVQSALSLFGLFSKASDERDGLLCDHTVEGMKRWAQEIGGYFDLEPMERPLEPAAVACLFSVLTGLRNKLATLHVSHVPKDLFAEPDNFLSALASFLRTTSQSQAISPHAQPINYQVIHDINVAFAKTRQTEPYKVHRVLKNKIDDLTNVSSSIATNLNLSLRSSVSNTETLPPLGFNAAQRNDGLGASLMMEGETADLDSFVKGVVAAANHHHLKNSDVPATLRDLWGGRPGYHRIRRENKEAEREARGVIKAQSKDGFIWDGEEWESGFTWRGTGEKVHKTSQAIVDGFAGLTGIDLGRSSKKSTMESPIDSDTSGDRIKAQRALLPSLVITGEKSPEGTDQEAHYFHSPSSSYRSPNSSFTNLSESHVSFRDPERERKLRRLAEVTRPIDLSSLRASGRIARSDPAVLTLEQVRARGRAASGGTWKSDETNLGSDKVSNSGSPTTGRKGKEPQWDEPIARVFNDDMGCMTKLQHGSLKRRHSISHVVEAEWTHICRLKPEYLQVDVNLCSELLLARQHDLDSQNIAHILELMIHSLQRTSASLTTALVPLHANLDRLGARRTALTDHTRAGRKQTGEMNGQVLTANYQLTTLESKANSLDERLNNYRKRTEDVERAVEGLYTLERPKVEEDVDANAGEKGSENEETSTSEQEDQAPADAATAPAEEKQSLWSAVQDWLGLPRISITIEPRVKSR